MANVTSEVEDCQTAIRAVRVLWLARDVLRYKRQARAATPTLQTGPNNNRGVRYQAKQPVVRSGPWCPPAARSHLTMEGTWPGE